ncbi:MAG: hypothetical protein RR265_07840 [Cetobacterium sp.]|uniref:hypothetical protein n=1 Tax=Cetobacterium sp. TaxID=2071632 RepID=UPI002FCA6977
MKNIKPKNNSVLSAIDSYFKLSYYNTTVSTEITAGITTFMTMAYILIVQPLFFLPLVPFFLFFY